MAENEQGKKTTLGSPDSRIGTRWIYTLRKDELLIFAQEFGFDGTGKVHFSPLEAGALSTTNEQLLRREPSTVIIPNVK